MLQWLVLCIGALCAPEGKVDRMKHHGGAVLALIMATVVMPGCQKGCQAPTSAPSACYLLAPPHAVRKSQTVAGIDPTAPFSEWQKKSMFTRQQDCEQARSGDLRDGRKLLRDAPRRAFALAHTSTTERWSSGYQMINEECVGDNDSRLKPPKVTWYLIEPPLSAGNQKPDKSAPLTKWYVARRFAWRTPCEGYKRGLPTHDPGQCVASDDPRLKGK